MADNKKNIENKEGGKTNIIGYIKHLFKDPITTVDECEARKKEIMPWFLGSIGLAVVPSAIGGAVSALSFLTIFGMIGIFAVMFFGFLLYVTIKAKEKFKALTCDKCNVMAEIKTPEDFAKYVSYTVGKNVAVYDGVSHPASNNGVVSEIKATASASVKVAIDLTCPHCGNVKPLEYQIVPFKCAATQSKVLVRDVELVKSRLDGAVRAAVADYNDLEKRPNIPYSIHSVNHPRYEERTKPQAGNSDAFPDYNGATIKYRKDPEEMVEQFFLHNQLDGKIIDINNKGKKK